MVTSAKFIGPLSHTKRVLLAGPYSKFLIWP
jgi:hypothetical protein